MSSWSPCFLSLLSPFVFSEDLECVCVSVCLTDCEVFGYTEGFLRACCLLTVLCWERSPIHVYTSAKVDPNSRGEIKVPCWSWTACCCKCASISWRVLKTSQFSSVAKSHNPTCFFFFPYLVFLFSCFFLPLSLNLSLPHSPSLR